MGIMQPWLGFSEVRQTRSWTDLERQIQECEGESLETFSDGMKIAVLASHAPESIRNLVRLAAVVQQAGNIEWCARTCQSFCSSAESSMRMVEEWSRNPAVEMRHRWMLTPYGKDKGNRMLRVRTSRPRSRKTASSIKPRAKARAARQRRRPRLTRTVPPS